MVEYARQYKFSQADYDELYKRLQQLERLMKQHDVSSADDLLQLAEDKVRRRLLCPVDRLSVVCLVLDNMPGKGTRPD